MLIYLICIICVICGLLGFEPRHNRPQPCAQPALNRNLRIIFKIGEN